MVRVERRGRALRIAVQHGRGAAVRAQRVREDGRGVRPAQAVPFQLQRAQHRRGRRERVERAEPVGDEARVPLRGPDRAAQLGLRLQEEHVPARVGEHGGGHQAVVATPDDDRVHLEDGHAPILPLSAGGDDLRQVRERVRPGARCPNGGNEMYSRRNAGTADQS